MFAGIGVSSFGLLLQVLKLLEPLFWVRFSEYFGEYPLTNKVNPQLTLREIEYLDKIRQMDLVIYGELLRELSHDRPSAFSSSMTHDETSMVTLLPNGK